MPLGPKLAKKTKANGQPLELRAGRNLFQLCFSCMVQVSPKSQSDCRPRGAPVLLCSAGEPPNIKVLVSEQQSNEVACLSSSRVFAMRK